MFTIEDIFEYIWTVELDKGWERQTDAKPLKEIGD
jgi:hypothetical protein